MSLGILFGGARLGRAALGFPTQLCVHPVQVVDFCGNLLQPMNFGGDNIVPDFRV